MKKLLTVLLTLVMAVCLINLNNSYSKADDGLDTPFTITAMEDGTTISLIKTGTYYPPTLNYSKNGATPETYNYGSSITGLSKGDTVSFTSTSSDSKVLSKAGNMYIKVNATGKITASGNIMSLISSNFSNLTEIPGEMCFYSLFNGCTKLISIDDLKLPATGLKTNCYSTMFNGCSGLTSLPENLLPATTLANNCYASMFKGCSGLTTLPEKLLPATTLTSRCYNGMFEGCTSLVRISNLPATTLADYCYQYMFSGCTGLSNGMKESSTGDFTEAFTIPSGGETPSGGQYQTNYMFYNTGLDQAPTLPKTYYRKPSPNPVPTPETGDMNYDSTKQVGDTTGAFVDSVQKGNDSKAMHVINIAANNTTSKVYKKGSSGWESTPVESSNYTLSSDSETNPKYTKLTFKSDYITNELGVGTYDFKVVLNDSATNTVVTFYIQLTVTDAPTPSPTPDPGKKDESCEKVIGPTWHWNNDKGICEDYGVVGTSTR